MAFADKQSRFVTEVPTSLKQLARFVVRGFYTIEDALIIDMLVRNPCMKEDDIAELLRFEKKQLRSRLAILRSDKFLQVRLKMETGPDSKAQKVNYYFINYKSFVNVVKYKLDIMRKRMETEERDATSRASFKCTNCNKSFTDLEADQLFDPTTEEFRCTFCGCAVEEDRSALPKKDSRLMLARFNDQLQTLYDLLREVEGVQLAPEILEPEPVDIDTIRGLTNNSTQRSTGGNEMWSGEATRNHGFGIEKARFDVTINDEKTVPEIVAKPLPVWMTDSTIVPTNDHQTTTKESITNSATGNVSNTSSLGGGGNRNKKEIEDIMSVLLQHEKHTDHSVKGLKASNNSSDSSDDELVSRKDPTNDIDTHDFTISESDEDNDLPVVQVAGRSYTIDRINDDLVRQMTPQEKENYIHVYQLHYSHMYD